MIDGSAWPRWGGRQRRTQVRRWRDDLANQRLYGTTRERPVVRLLVERPHPHALPPHPTFLAQNGYPLTARYEPEHPMN